MTWQGERREQLRASFTIRDGQPVVQELAGAEGQAATGSSLGSKSHVPSFRSPAASGVCRSSRSLR